VTTGVESDRIECLEAARAGFEEAARRAPIWERAHSIAGRTVLLRVAGPELASRLAPALGHHPTPDGPAPCLVVNAWDIEATGVSMPRFPASAIDGGRSARERVNAPERVRIHYGFNPRALSVLDEAVDAAYVGYGSVASLPSWELGAPLLVTLHWRMHRQGRYLVHGAALGKDRGGVLLVARGGSGKSSTALATLSPRGRETGLRYAADDYCLVGIDGEPRAYSLYGTGKIDGRQAARFPDLVTGPTLNPGRAEDEKIVMLVAAGAPGMIIQSFRLLSLVVPVIDGGPCRVEPISPGLALRALAPSTVLQLSGAGGPTLAAMAELVRRIPAHALHLAPDPRDAPAVLAQLVDRLAGR
jgi:hypothetical protein